MSYHNGCAFDIHSSHQLSLPTHAKVRPTIIISISQYV